MARFRVPSSSLASTASPRNTSVKAKKTRGTSRRARVHKLDKAKAAVKDAAKRAQKTKRLTEPCIAYVGNLGPDVDEKTLVEHFSQFGKIISTRIHCCGGVAMTVKPPPVGYHQDMKIRQYAILIFQSKSARHRACKQENTLNGRDLIVSVTVSDLPEVREKVTERLEDYRARLEPADVGRAQRSALRSLKMDPTVLLDMRKKRKRLQVMGMSLPEGIM